MPDESESSVLSLAVPLNTADDVAITKLMEPRLIIILSAGTFQLLRRFSEVATNLFLIRCVVT